MVTTVTDYLRFRVSPELAARARAAQRRGAPGTPVLRVALDAGLTVLEQVPADTTSGPRVQA